MECYFFWLSFLVLFSAHDSQADVNDDKCKTYEEVATGFSGHLFCGRLHVDHGRVCYTVQDSFIGIDTSLSARVKRDVGFRQNRPTISYCGIFDESWYPDISPCEPVPTPVMKANAMTVKPDDVDSNSSTTALVLPLVIVLLLIVAAITIAFILWRRRRSRRRSESTNRIPGYCNGRQTAAITNQIYDNGTLIISCEKASLPPVCKGNSRTDLRNKYVNSDVDDYENVQGKLTTENIETIYKTQNPENQLEPHSQCTKTLSADYETAFPKIDKSDTILQNEEQSYDENNETDYVNTSAYVKYSNAYN